MAIHSSLRTASRTGSATHTGRWIPVAGRTDAPYLWNVTVDVGEVQSGTVSVVLEGALRRDEDRASTLHTFSVLSSPARLTGQVTVSGYLAQGFVRAVATTTGSAMFGTREESRFFAPQVEYDRMDKQLQAWDERERAAGQAERDLIEPYRRGDRYALRMDAPGFSEAVRDAIGLQLRRRFEIEVLSRSPNPADRVTLRETSDVDNRAAKLIRHYATDVHAVHF